MWEYSYSYIHIGKGVISSFIIFIIIAEICVILNWGFNPLHTAMVNKLWSVIKTGNSVIIRCQNRQRSKNNLLNKIILWT